MHTIVCVGGNEVLHYIWIGITRVFWTGPSVWSEQESMLVPDTDCTISSRRLDLHVLVCHFSFVIEEVCVEFLCIDLFEYSNSSFTPVSTCGTLLFSSRSGLGTSRLLLTSTAVCIFLKTKRARWKLSHTEPHMMMCQSIGLLKYSNMTYVLHYFVTIYSCRSNLYCDQ